MALQQALRHGLILKKVHRAIKYEQRAWLKSYIDFNTEQRAKAKDDFEKDLFKLMNNAIFGKTMENMRGRIDFEVVINDARFDKIVSSSRFHGKGVWFSKDVVGLHRVKTKTDLNKPIYCGQAILDLSKVHMYWFHYDVMKPKYGDKLKLLATDTDSLKYHVETHDLYKDMKAMGEHFDFSDYPKDHPCYDATNKKVIGKFKDEMKSKPITMICALRAKVYVQDTLDGSKKIAKSVSKPVVKHHLTPDDYVNAVLNDVVIHKHMMNFRSYGHEVFTQQINKIALSAFDDKRYVLSNRVDCRALGHYLNSI
jgi:hypothetical protein